jgi:hypothetical protein
MDGIPLNLQKLASPSREFASRLLESVSELARFASMKAKPGDPEQLDLFVKAPSPTGDPDRTLVIWMADDDPSIAFGPNWHTHASLRGDALTDGCDALINLARAILADDVVLYFDIGKRYLEVIDLRDPDAIIDELTSPHSSGKAELRSWAGTVDRFVGLDDLD